MHNINFKSFLLPGKHIANQQTTMVCINGNVDFSKKPIDVLLKTHSTNNDIIVFSDDLLQDFYNICKWRLPKFPSDAHHKAYSLLVSSEDSGFVLPWRKILGTKQYFETCMTYAQRILSSLNATPGIQYVYHIAHLQHKHLVLQKLQHSKSNNKIIKQHATDPNTSLSQKELLRSFISNPSNPSWDASRNLLYPPQSTLSSTRTGRAKLIKGPNLGHLQKDFRDIIESRFGADGQIWYLDYSSLEPRVLWHISKAIAYNHKLVETDTLLKCAQQDSLSDSLTNCFHYSIKESPIPTPYIQYAPLKMAHLPVKQEVAMRPRGLRRTPVFLESENADIKDIYTDFLNVSGLGSRVPRDIAKTAIISALYGQSQKNFEESLRQYVVDPEDLYKGIEEYFGLAKLKSMLIEQLEETKGSYITNLYGRPVFPEDAKEYALVNYYIQSTAVDVAFFGFQGVIKKISQLNLNNTVFPIFVLHDAILLDMHNSALDKLSVLEKAGSTNIPLFENKNFFLQASPLKKP
jgi:hypothetical protein